MKRVEKKVTVKMETIEQWLARGGKIKKASFDLSHGKFSKFGRNFKDYRTNFIKAAIENKNKRAMA